MKVAIIPARGGSKRIPRKNIRDFRGQPLIAYSIRAAIKSELFDEVIVSTDDDEIAAIAREYGATTPFVRPADISDDHATTEDVIVHALEWYVEQSLTVNEICCIYATAPFIQVSDICKAHQLLMSSEKQFVFPVTSFPFPIQRAVKLGQDACVSMFSPEHMQTRSQDLEEAYHDVGQFYWGKSEAFLQRKPLFSNAAVGLPIPRYRVQDIDTLEDWKRAEMLYQVLHDGGEIE